MHFKVKKYLVTTLAAMTALTSLPITVKAEEEHVISTFEVTEEDIEICNYSVSIPENLPLVYDKEIQAYVAKDKIGVSGELSENLSIQVSSNTTVTYTNQLDGNIVTGVLEFGDEGLCIWTAEDVTNQKEQEFSITVDANQTLTKGSYMSDLSFEIQVLDETCEHDLSYVDNEDGTHTVSCANCEVNEIEACEYDENGICTKCGSIKINEVTVCEEHTYTYTDNENGTHNAVCSECATTVCEACEYDENDTCTKCGTIKVNESVNTEPIEPANTDPVEPANTDPVEPTNTDPVEPVNTESVEPVTE